MNKDDDRVIEFCECYSISRINLYRLIAKGQIRVRKCKRRIPITKQKSCYGKIPKRRIRRRKTFSSGLCVNFFVRKSK